MKIPKKFKLFGTTINVLFDSEKMNKDSTIGISEHSKSKITLTDKYNGEKLSDDMILDSFYHEKVHMILDSMYEHKLSSNERFVEIFSRLLRQSIESAEM